MDYYPFERGENNPNHVKDGSMLYELFSLEDGRFLITRFYQYPVNWDRRLAFVTILLALGITLFFGYKAWKNRSTQVESTPQVTEGPVTATPEPTTTATAEPSEGDAAILKVDLDQPVPETASELIEWLNSHMPEINLPLLEVDFPLPNWLVDLFTQGATVVKLPQGMDGFVFVVHNPDGNLEVIRTNDQFEQVGSPIYLDGTKFTLEAKDLHWGIEYSPKKNSWLDPSSRKKSDLKITVIQNDMIIGSQTLIERIKN